MKTVYHINLYVRLCMYDRLFNISYEYLINEYYITVLLYNQSWHRPITLNTE